MVKLKLGPVIDDKPVKVTVELPAGLHRNMTPYGEILGCTAGQGAVEPVHLIMPILEPFLAMDRGFGGHG
ncbi:DUF2274 domain-containing protein [Paracoccus methylovorus]|uniref:DUF2274 domain-containing protein n=1 Tax=Paracoccus methylovorus TaxID=2812658 RepID=A0ABX7JQL5_9RHOB|nr:MULTISPECIES: DUF2274 domain-containing protein [Paracoccus]QRZ15781.1 DUF2274 domain-containing protein [Paracoccus methylovorus]